MKKKNVSCLLQKMKKLGKRKVNNHKKETVSLLIHIDILFRLYNAQKRRRKKNRIDQKKYPSYEQTVLQYYRSIPNQ
jgi:hypothetical protein